MVPVDDGGPGVSADDVGGGDEVQGSGEIQLLRRIQPAGREIPVAVGAVGIVVVVKPIEGGVDRSQRSVVLVTLYNAVGDAEGEGGIRGHIGTVDGEVSPPQGAGNLSLLGFHRHLNPLGLGHLPDHLPGHPDGRVFHGEGPFFQGPGRRSRIRQNRPFHDDGGQPLRGASLKHLLHEGMIRSVVPNEILETVCHLGLVELPGLGLGQDGVLDVLQGLERSSLSLGREILECGQGTAQGHGAQGGMTQSQEGRQLGGDLPLPGLELSHSGDEIPILVLESRIRLDGGLELSLVIPALGHDDGVMKALHDSRLVLQKVHESKNGIPKIHLPGFLGMPSRKLLQHRSPGPEQIQERLVLDVPAKLQLSHCVQAGGVPGISDNEHQVALGDALLVEGEVVLRPEGIPALVVDPVEAHVQVVAGIGEVVPVSTEVGDLELRRHDQPEIRVSFEDVHGVSAPGVELHHLDVVAALLSTELLGDFGQNGLLDLFPAPGSLLGSRHAFQSLVHPVRHVPDLHELIGPIVRDRTLLLQGGGVEPVCNQIFILPADRLDVIPGTVMVGHDQAVG